jgi:cytidyltransferase-like protein
VTDYWVYVGGNFDLFHPGHVRLLQGAKAFGPVVVALNTDEFACDYKRRPVMSLEERCEVVKACRYVDHVVVNHGGRDSGVTIDGLLKDGLKVRYIVHGSDWERGSLMTQMGLTESWMETKRIAFLFLPYTDGVSSAQIEDRVLELHDQVGSER